MKLYFCPRPNPLKVALFLEESGIEHEIIPVDPLCGSQHQTEFLTLNPNAKLPVLVDGDVVIFDSTAILFYLVAKTKQFGAGTDPVLQGQFLSWMLFIASGLGPFSGQAVHFRHHAPGGMPYAVNRYRFEAERHWAIIEARLAEQAYLLGQHYSALDMALWGWAPALTYLLGDDAWTNKPNLARWLARVEARPAVGRVKKLASAYSYKVALDDEALRNMFPQNTQLDVETAMEGDCTTWAS